MSLYVKFIWFTVATMLISSLLSFFGMNLYYHAFVKESNNEKNLAIAYSFAELADGRSSVEAGQVFETLGDAGYQIVLMNGEETLRFGGEYRDETIGGEHVEAVLNGEAYNGIRDFPRQTFVTGFFANELRNTVGVPVEIEDQTYALFMRPNIGLLFRELHFLFAGLALGIVLLSVTGMVVVARLLIKPITKLTIATEMMGDETFDVPLAIRRKDEIGRLADQFLTMRERIKRSTDKRKEFVHNVSHDLQSPLHTIQSYVRVVKNPASESEREEALAVIQREADRLSRLTNQLLTLASFDSDRIEWTETVPLDEQLRDTLRYLRHSFDEKEMGIEARLEPVTMEGNAVLLRTVWENVLTNAQKYSGPGAMVQVTLEKSGEQAVIRVKDEGIGMSEEETVQAFDRFYRADAARTRPSKGSGLGLAIVKEIIMVHGGTVDLISRPGEGTTVVIILPLSQ